MINRENDLMPVRIDRVERVNLLVLLFSGAALIGVALGGQFVDSWIGLIAWAASAEWLALLIIGIAHAVRLHREGKHG